MFDLKHCFKVWNLANQSVIKRFLLEKTINIKQSQLRKGFLSTDSCMDKYLFKTVRKLLGQRLKVCMTSTAPIGSEVFNFVRIAMGVPIIQGYGLTESCASATVSFNREFTCANGGTPILCNYIKLIDVPEFNFLAKERVGEICLKGTNIFKGYYNDVETTKQRLDENGWLHTGDLGGWLPNGCLKIVDCIADLFKLSTGIVIAPLSIESVLSQALIVSQIFVYGNKTSSGIVAIVFPHQSLLPTWCKKRGFSSYNSALLNSETVKRLMLGELKKIGTASGLKPYYLPQLVHLSDRGFTVENNLLSPTLRNRRQSIYNCYENELMEMCKKLKRNT